MNGNAGSRSADSPASRQGSCLDLEHLRHYTGDDQSLQAELLSLFKVQARVQADLISIARLPSDYRMALHTLRGAALAIGANAIAQTAAELEALALAAHSGTRRQLIARLAREIAAVEAEIDRLGA